MKNTKMKNAVIPALTLTVINAEIENTELSFERQVQILRDARTVYSVTFSEAVKGLEKGSDEYKARKADWNKAKQTVAKYGDLASSDAKPRLVTKMTGQHRFVKSAKVIPGSVADAACELDRIAKLDASVPFFMDGSTVQSFETGLAVKELAAIAKQQRRVPYSAYEVAEDGERKLSMSAAIAWIEQLDMARIAMAKQASDEIRKQMASK
jgi:hypothetical protein